MRAFRFVAGGAVAYMAYSLLCLLLQTESARQYGGEPRYLFEPLPTSAREERARLERTSPGVTKPLD